MLLTWQATRARLLSPEVNERIKPGMMPTEQAITLLDQAYAIITADIDSLPPAPSAVRQPYQKFTVAPVRRTRAALNKNQISELAAAALTAGGITTHVTPRRDPQDDAALPAMCALSL